jgi:ferredoxin
MCEFCIEHGEGKKWYLLMKNYSKELLHQELSGAEAEESRAQTRAEWLRRFSELFSGAAALGTVMSREQLAGLVSTSELAGKAEAQRLEGRKVVHFGQVLPIEDVEEVLDLVTSIIRIPCGCRFLAIGKTDKRYCFGLGMDPLGIMGKYPDSSASLEVLDREEAKKIIRQLDDEGLIHTIWTAITPYVVGICNCDRDCLAYKSYIEQRGTPTFFRAEYVARIDPELCSGCKECLKQCQFDAQFYSSARGKVDINPTRCYGCGVCRASCPTQAISLIPRKDEPKVANLWLKEEAAVQAAP